MLKELNTLPDNETLIRKYGKTILIIATRMIRNKETAEEAAQEAWIEILKSLDKIADPGKLKSYIYTIAKRTIFRYAIKERTYTEQELSHFFRTGTLEKEEGIESRTWVKLQCHNCLIGILHCLDNNQRLIYIFKDIINLSFKEIGAIMEITEPNVRKIISRTRKKLKNFLNRECYLFNPRGRCSCKVKSFHKELDAEKEFSRLKKIIRTFTRLKTRVLPGKEFWLQNFF